MFYYPVSSAFFGVSLNLMFLSTVILLSWYRFFSPESGSSNDEDKWFLNEREPEEVEDENEFQDASAPPEREIDKDEDVQEEPELDPEADLAKKEDFEAASSTDSFDDLEQDASDPRAESSGSKIEEIISLEEKKDL